MTSLPTIVTITHCTIVPSPSFHTEGAIIQEIQNCHKSHITLLWLLIYGSQVELVLWAGVCTEIRWGVGGAGVMFLTSSVPQADITMLCVALGFNLAGPVHLPHSSSLE